MGCKVLRRTVWALASVALVTPAWAADEAAEQAEAPRIYMAPLQPLNTGITGQPVSGAALFVRDGDRLQAYVRAIGVAPNMMHRQMIHVGSECPTPQADANGDNVVDVMEGVPSYGLVLIPLDDDLTRVAENDYPRTGAQERLEYGETAAFETLERSVTGDDPNPDDPIVKLEQGASLDLAGKTVVIHGVPETTDLPDSVQGVAGVAPHLTVPVACGVIEPLR